MTTETVEAPIVPMRDLPASIVMAICQIQVTVDAVKKTHKNQHGGYMFASTDDIYAAVTRKMGEVGLVCLSLEERETEVVRVEKEGKTSQWGKFLFSFVLATKDATWTDPRCRRSLFIQITGPQTFQAATSYAEKSFLKSLFKLPTGDMELDGMPQGESEEDQVALNAIGRTKRKSSAEGKRDGSVKRFNELIAKIEKATGAIDCQEIWNAHATDLSVMPRGWFETIASSYEMTMKGFGVEVEAGEQNIQEAAE